MDFIDGPWVKYAAFLTFFLLFDPVFSFFIIAKNILVMDEAQIAKRVSLLLSPSLPDGFIVYWVVGISSLDPNILSSRWSSCTSPAWNAFRPLKLLCFFLHNNPNIFVDLSLFSMHRSAFEI